MEEMKLTKEQVEELKNQYYGLTEDLKQYRRLFRQRRYWEEPKRTRHDTRSQYNFLKGALNATIETLIATDNLPGTIASSAIFNRFITWRTKYAIIQNRQQWTMQQ